MRVTVLASGSAGNATLVESNGFGVLLDAGLGPRQLSARLTQAGSSWSAIQAMLLTHAHSDHWKDSTLAHLLRRKIPLFCHPGQHPALRKWGQYFPRLQAAGLVHDYQANEFLELSPQLRCLPLPVSHDSGDTFGFRLEGVRDLFGEAPALGYVADLGCWTDSLVEQLANVELLALEFNHDVAMQYASGRAPRLIARVLGDAGHLSNEQAADLLRAVIQRSTPGRLKHVVQLHLSRECNHPSLAARVGRMVLTELDCSCELHTASQDEVGPTLDLSSIPRPRRVPRLSSPRRRSSSSPQVWLPGME